MRTDDELAAPSYSSGVEAAHWFFEHSVDVFLITDAGSIRQVNPAWTRLTGWSETETLGKRLSDFIHPDDAEIVRGVRDALDADRQSTAEHRIRSKDGAWLWMRSRAKRDQHNRAIVVLQDVTEDKLKAEEADRSWRSSELLREAAGVFMWRFDPKTNLYLFSRDRLRARSKDASHHASRSAAEVRRGIHPDDRIAVEEAWGDTLASGAFRVVEYRQETAKGKHAHFRAAWRGERPSASGGWEIIGVTQDITELVKARDAAIDGQQAAQAAAEAKAQFLANMSHEIRTPLNGVLGVVHLLKREPLSAEGRGLVSEALACGEMLGRILNDVIDFSKIEAGKLELSPEPLDPGVAVKGVLDLLTPQAEAKGLWLRCDVDASIGRCLMDSVRFRQVLFNLIGNAVKFTLEGGVDVRLTAQERTGDRWLRLEVSDTGIGIAPEAQKVLFERFQQADGSTTRRFGGSGLGLSISRRLAQMMGGELDFATTPGRGSCFWIDLPAPPAPDAPDALAEGLVVFDGLSVLVAEDNPTNQLIIDKMLTALGASVRVVSDGRQCVEEAVKAGYDLILMDIQMPHMDGLSATQAIRRLEGPAGTAPIIALTANALTHQTAGYIEAGMNGSIAKPLSPRSLVAEISRVLSEAA